MVSVKGRVIGSTLRAAERTHHLGLFAVHDLAIPGPPVVRILEVT